MPPPSLSRIVTLNTHSVSSRTTHDVYCDPKLFDSPLRLGDVLEIQGVEITLPLDSPFPPDSDLSDQDEVLLPPTLSSSHPPSPHPSGTVPGGGMTTTTSTLLVQVTSMDPPLGTRVQISLNRAIANEFGFKRFSTIRVSRLKQEKKYEATFVELSFRGKYMSNGELWLIRSALRNKPLFAGQVIKAEGVEFKVEEISPREEEIALVSSPQEEDGGGKTPSLAAQPPGGTSGGSGNGGRKKGKRCGIITKRTRFVFRSGSAQIFWLIQLSKEMWDFADDGDLLNERLFRKFIPEVLDRWNAQRARHALTVVFFTRTVFNGTPAWKGNANSALNRFSNPNDLRRYVDFYHVALSNVTPKSEWKSILGQLQEDFHAFPKRANWAVEVNSSSHVCGLPSIAQEGNTLEAINLALNVMEKHYVDRDLYRTGQLILLMTPGSGVFEADSALALLTKDRLTSQAIGCDVVSLTNPPAHVVPLFVHHPSLNKADMVEFDQPHPFDSTQAFGGGGSNIHSTVSSRVNSTTTSPVFGSTSPATTMGGESNMEELLGSPPLISRTISGNVGWLDATSSPQRGGGGRGGGAAPNSMERSKIPVYNVPHWMSLSFPFSTTKARALLAPPTLRVPPTPLQGPETILGGGSNHSYVGTFQPIFENRMFPIHDPRRSSFPSALLAPLERSSLGANMDLDLTVPVATWATTRRIPSRDEMRPWFPLLGDIRAMGGEHYQILGTKDSGSTPPTMVSRIIAPNTSVVHSASSFGLLNGNSAFLMSDGTGVVPSVLRSKSSLSPRKTQGRIVGGVMLSHSSSSGTASSIPPPPGTGGPTLSSIPSAKSWDHQRMEPSPSLVALQLYTGGGDRGLYHPKVSWIQDSNLHNLSLPPPHLMEGSTMTTQRIPPTSHAFSSQDLSSAPSLVLPSSSVSFSHDKPITSSASSHHVSIAPPRTTVPSFHSELSDENAIRNKQKRHDALVFAAPYRRRRASPTKRSLLSLPTNARQSVNDLALLATTPLREPKRRLATRRSSEVSSMPESIGIFPTSPGGPFKLERSVNLKSSTSGNGKGSLVMKSPKVRDSIFDHSDDEVDNNERGEEGNDDDAHSQSSTDSRTSSSQHGKKLGDHDNISTQGSSFDVTAATNASNFVATTTASASSVGNYVPLMNPFQFASLLKWSTEHPSHSRSRWLHLFPPMKRHQREREHEARMQRLKEANDEDTENDDDVYWEKWDDILLGGGADSVDLDDYSAMDEEKQVMMRRIKFKLPNWKSLQTPALLPFSTGFAPASYDLTNKYLFASYSLVGQRHQVLNKVLLEVMCIRLSENFQIYNPDVDDEDEQRDDDKEDAFSFATFAGARFRASASERSSILSSSRVTPQQRGLVSSSNPPENYVLTIGHHVHMLRYSKTSLVVTPFGKSPDHEPFEHRCWIWDSNLDAPALAVRTFSEQSASECDWNYVDNLLMGESIHDLPESEFRFRALKFCVANNENVKNLVSFLRTDASAGWFGGTSKVPVSSLSLDSPGSQSNAKDDDGADAEDTFTKERKKSRASSRASTNADDEFEVDHRLSTEIDDDDAVDVFSDTQRMSQDDDSPRRRSGRVKFAVQSYEPVVKLASPCSPRGETRYSPRPISATTTTLEIPLHGSSLRPRQWLYVDLDDALYSDRIFHMEIRFVVASADAVTTFLDAIAERVNCRLVQIASYCRTFDQRGFVVPRRVVLKEPKATDEVVATLMATKLFAYDSVTRDGVVLARCNPPDLFASVFCRVDENSNLDFLPNPYCPCLDFLQFTHQCEVTLNGK